MPLLRRHFNIIVWPEQTKIYKFIATYDSPMSGLFFSSSILWNHHKTPKLTSFLRDSEKENRPEISNKFLGGIWVDEKIRILVLNFMNLLFILFRGKSSLFCGWYRIKGKQTQGNIVTGWAEKKKFK